MLVQKVEKVKLVQGCMIHFDTWASKSITCMTTDMRLDEAKGLSSESLSPLLQSNSQILEDIAHL